MVSELAKGDYEDLRAEGLSPTLEDFDRLNRLALRLTDGAETTVANFPRVGWAGDVPFYQPTNAAFEWYLEKVDRPSFDPAFKDVCWFYALAHARKRGSFDDLDGDRIREVVSAWFVKLPVTREEIIRACHFASVGFDDAEAGRTDAQREAEAVKTPADKREESLTNLENNVSLAAAITGIAPNELKLETPSRLKAMIDMVRNENVMSGGGDKNLEKSRLTADYQLAFREIKQRLMKERDNGKQ